MIGQRVATLRRQHDLSQSDLAERVGVVQPTISKIERNRTKRIDMATLRRIATVLETSLDDLLAPEQIVTSEIAAPAEDAA